MIKICVESWHYTLTIQSYTQKKNSSISNNFMLWFKDFNKKNSTHQLWFKRVSVIFGIKWKTLKPSKMLLTVNNIVWRRIEDFWNVVCKNMIYLLLFECFRIFMIPDRYYNRLKLGVLCSCRYHLHISLHRFILFILCICNLRTCSTGILHFGMIFCMCSDPFLWCWCSDLDTTIHYHYTRHGGINFIQISI